MLWTMETAALLIPMLFLLIGLAVTMLIDPYISRKHRVVMLIIIALSAFLIAQNLIENLLAEGQTRWFLRTTTAVFGYTLRPVFMILFLYIIRPEKKHMVCWGLAILNWAVYMTAYFSHLSFWISSGNKFYRGPLSYTCLVISLILMGNLLLQSFHAYRGPRKHIFFIPVMVVLMILASVFLDGEVKAESQPVTFLTCSIVIGSVFYYIWLHLRFVQEHEEDLKAQQRIRILLGQIQPHFLYNTLGAIKYTYYDDPAHAREAIDQFSSFLRHNMDSLTDDRPIPFINELEHVKCYLNLLQLRFGDTLTVEYDLKCTDFQIPALTLQPIVENAVIYGVRKNVEGKGAVLIRSLEYQDHYEVHVKDNGPGFVKDTSSGDGEHSHIGLQNVKDRLRQMVGGNLEIYSVPGEGTAVTITLPKDKETRDAHFCH